MRSTQIILGSFVVIHLALAPTILSGQKRAISPDSIVIVKAPSMSPKLLLMPLPSDSAQPLSMPNLDSPRPPSLPPAAPGIDAAAQVQHCVQVREIQYNQIPDAMASFDGMGLVIYYNPSFLQRAGQLLGAFLHAHEYGHICLGHVQVLANSNPYQQYWLSPQLELAADCYATRYLRVTNPGAVQAAYQNFLSQGYAQGSPVHPPAVLRAQTIYQCYMTP